MQRLNDNIPSDPEYIVGLSCSYVREARRNYPGGIKPGGQICAYAIENDAGHFKTSPVHGKLHL